jgi:diguanylate cyclase (GGDEF)-like protein
VARPAAPRRPENVAWLITAPLAAIAVILFVPALAGSRPGHLLSPPAVTGLFFLLFLLAETTNLNLEVRRHGLRITLTEIPLVLALFYLSPLSLLAVRLFAFTLVQVRRRVTPVKLAFNVANMVAGMSAAILIVHSAGTLHDKSPATWLVVFAAVGANVLSTVAAVIGVIALIQGGMSVRRVLRTGTPSLVVGAINTTVGLVILLAVERSSWAPLLIAVVAAALVVVYRAYAQFLQQHKSLTEIYDLTRVIAETRNDGTLADVLLGRVRELVQAECATLWLPAQARYPEMLLSARVDDAGLIDLSSTPEGLRARAVETGTTVAAGPKLGDDQLRAILQQAGVKDAIVVPMRSGSAVIGCLEVTSRLGAENSFGPDDVRLVETVAAHTAVAVENSRLVDRLRFDAHHDALTGLPNRRRMLAALEEAVKVRAPGEVVAIIQFDVSGLRDVNESLGHAAGDKLLAEVARRLRILAPPAALVARVGGDEFAMTLRMAGVEEAIELASELRRGVQDPMEIGSLTLDVDTAVGIAVHPDHGSDPAALLQRADVATHAAKSMSSAVQVFNLGLESRSARRLGLAGDLRRALDNGELDVVFQPKVTLAGRQLIGVECLARWDHGAHGSVAPEDFVAVAEHTGQLNRLTETVLKEGLRRCRQWADAGRPLNVAVNLSSRTLLDPDFPARVSALLDEYGVPARQLTLEISEAGVTSDSERPLPTLRKLHELGVRLAVDDFGTGYSSLSHLRRLPVDEVKIDRAFVQGMATDPGDLAIVKAVVDLSRHFGLSVVAEGVESELTLTLLEEIGCDLGQGFLFSRPLPYDRLEAWFAAQTEPEPTSIGGEVRRLRAVP